MPEKQSKRGGRKRRSRSGDGLTQYFLILFQADADDINRQLVREIQAQLDDTIKTPVARTAIDVWIESPGGDAHAAYKLAVDLRSRCTRLRAVIPDLAKSAATLLVLGMDQIYMRVAAELGPLDMQISHPDREEVIISALSVADSLEVLARNAFGLAASGGAALLYYTGLGRAEVLNATLPFVAQFLQPIVAKHDPHLLHQATNQLRIAEHYAIDLLSRGNQLSDEDKAWKLLHDLIHHYPAHETVITRREARDKLGLPVLNIEGYEHRQVLDRVYKGFVDDEDEESLVFVLDDITKLEPPRTSRRRRRNETTTSQSNGETAREEAAGTEENTRRPRVLSARA